MKKALAALTAVFIIFLLFHFRPMDLRNRIERISKDEIEVYYYETEHLDEIKYMNKSWRFRINTDDKEYGQLLSILGKYTYRNSLMHAGSFSNAYLNAAGLTQSQSIRIHDFSIGNQSCAAGNMPCAIGSGKEDYERLFHELYELIFSWEKDYLYREVTFDGNSRIADDQKYFYIEND